MPSSSLEVPPHETQFEAHSTDDEDGLWDVKKILDEDVAHGEYFVEWEGTDPTTGEPWAPTWVKKTDCTDLLIRDWKEEQARQQKAKQRPAQKTTMRPNFTTATKSKDKRTKSSESAKSTKSTKEAPRSKSSSSRVRTPPTRPRTRSGAGSIHSAATASPIRPIPKEVPVVEVDRVSESRKRAASAAFSASQDPQYVPNSDEEREMGPSKKRRKNPRSDVESEDESFPIVPAGKRSDKGKGKEVVIVLDSDESQGAPPKGTEPSQEDVDQFFEPPNDDLPPVHGLSTPPPAQPKPNGTIVPDSQDEPQAQPSSQPSPLPNPSQLLSHRSVQGPSGHPNSNGTRSPRKVSGPSAVTLVPKQDKVSRNGRGTKKQYAFGPQLKPVPVMSPSVFKPHLRTAQQALMSQTDFDPPESQIEQFSSPISSDESKQNRPRNDARDQTEDISQISKSAELPPVQREFGDVGDPSGLPEPPSSFPDQGQDDSLWNQYIDAPSDDNMHPPTPSKAISQPSSQIAGPSEPTKQTGVGKEVAKPHEESQEEIIPASVSTHANTSVDISFTPKSSSESLQRRLKSTLDLLSRKNDEIEELKREAASAEEVAELKESLARVQAELDFQSSARAELEAALRKRAELIKEQRTTIAQLTKALEELIAEGSQSVNETQVNGELVSAIDALEAELEKAENDNKTLAAEVEALQKEKATLAKAKLRALEDFDYITAQYREASTAAAQLGEENRVLAERNEILDGQNRYGVQQAKLHFAATVALLKAEAERKQNVIDMLQEKDRRTGDDVRRRAGECDEFKADNIRLRKQRKETKAILQEKERRIQELEVLIMEPSQQVSSGSDYDGESDDRRNPRRSSRGSSTKRRSRGPAEKPSLVQPAPRCIPPDLLSDSHPARANPLPFTQQFLNQLQGDRSSPLRPSHSPARLSSAQPQPSSAQASPFRGPHTPSRALHAPSRASHTPSRIQAEPPSSQIEPSNGIHPDLPPSSLRDSDNSNSNQPPVSQISSLSYLQDIPTSDPQHVQGFWYCSCRIDRNGTRCECAFSNHDQFLLHWREAHCKPEPLFADSP